MSTVKRRDVIVIALLLIGAGLALIPHHLVIDGNHPAIAVESFDDSANGGGSKTFPSDDTVQCHLRYYVSSQYEFPYVGRGFFIKDSASLIDLSSYQRMTIEVDPGRSDKFNCQLSFFVPGFSSMEAGPTQQVLLTPVLVKSGVTRYEYRFKELTTPQWWYQTNRVDEEKIPPLSYKKFAGISFSNHPLLEHDNEYTFLVKRVIFTKRYTKTALFLFGIALLYGVLLIFNRPKKAFVPYEPITLTAVDRDEERLLAYIGRHYTVRGLSLEDVSRETALSQSKVRTILRDTFSVSFKQYLNQLRISEAVRLIRETENPISEIGLSVGYKHVSTFNTSFKSLYGKSPSQLRNEERKA